MSISVHSAPSLDPERLGPPLVKATHHAAGALSEMAGRDIEVGEVGVRLVPLSQMTMVNGDPERPVVAVHVGVDGFNGHILLNLSEPMARGLVDMLLDQPEGTTESLGEMEASALAEVGNVTGTFFLSALADVAQITLPPTPPLVCYEMCGAILDSLATEMAMLGQDEAVVIDTSFSSAGQRVEVAFFMFPGPDLLAALTRQTGSEDDA